MIEFISLIPIFQKKHKHNRLNPKLLGWLVLLYLVYFGFLEGYTYVG